MALAATESKPAPPPETIPPVSPKPEPKPEPEPATAKAEAKPEPAPASTSAPATLVASATPTSTPLLNAPTPLLNMAATPTAPTSTAASNVKPAGGAKSKPRPPSMGEFAGRWKASPSKNVTIDLAIQPDKTFSWTVSGQQGSGQTLVGEFAYGGETLALVQENGTSMVGWLAWEDDNHFRFRIAGSFPEHPKLIFSR